MKTKAMRVCVTGRITEIAENAVASRVGRERYEAIKRLDPHPCWVTMTVAKAGESTGTVEVAGRVRNRRKRWPQAAIRELAGLMNVGNPFLAPDIVVGHEDPEPHGKLVAGWQEGDEARAIGLIANPEVQRQVAAGTLDSCSLDVLADMVEGRDGVVEVERVRKMRNVALASSRRDRPGFRAAAITSVVQETEGAASLSEVKRAAQEAGWTADAIFGKEHLLSLGCVKDAISDAEAAAKESAVRELEAARAEAAQGREALRALEAKTRALEVKGRRASAEIRKIVESAPATKDKGKLVVPYVQEFLSEAALAEQDPARLKAAIETEAEEIVRRGEAIGLTWIPSETSRTGTGGGPRPTGREFDPIKDAGDPERNPYIPRE